MYNFSAILAVSSSFLSFDMIFSAFCDAFQAWAVSILTMLTADAVHPIIFVAGHAVASVPLLQKCPATTTDSHCEIIDICATPGRKSWLRDRSHTACDHGIYGLVCTCCFLFPSEAFWSLIFVCRPCVIHSNVSNSETAEFIIKFREVPFLNLWSVHFEYLLLCLSNPRHGNLPGVTHGNFLPSRPLRLPNHSSNPEWKSLIPVVQRTVLPFPRLREGYSNKQPSVRDHFVTLYRSVAVVSARSSLLLPESWRPLPSASRVNTFSISVFMLAKCRRLFVATSAIEDEWNSFSICTTLICGLDTMSGSASS